METPRGVIFVLALAACRPEPGANRARDAGPVSPRGVSDAGSDGGAGEPGGRFSVIRPGAADAQAGPSASADAGPLPPEGPTGTIEGTVVFDGPIHPGVTAAVPPSFANNPGCRDAALRYAQPFPITSAGPFPGALVSALAHSARPGPHRDRIITFGECDILPRATFAADGDRIFLHSEATRPHMPEIHGAQGSILQVLIPHQPDQERNIPGPGSYPITARDLPNFVGAHLLVLPNRFIDTTDAAGHFRITDVPVGSVEVHAWYPGAHEGMGTVNVTPGGTANITLHIQQLPPRPAPAPSGPPVDAGYPFPT